MSVGILIISHNNIGESLINTANVMIKDNPLTTKIISAVLESTSDELYENATLLINELDQGDGVLILTDLFGSTPSNIAHRLLEKENVSIVSGINLSMLIRIFNYPHLNLKEITKKAYSGGIDGIKINGASSGNTG